MAINARILNMLLQVMQAAERKPCKLLCLGYPDLLVTREQLRGLLGGGADALEQRSDSEQIVRWHGLQGRLDSVAETTSVFKALGVDATFVDIKPSRGVEIPLDLNEPVRDELLGRFDVVYDGGTMEHCFNVGQVMKNLLAMTREGGFILHLNPLNFFNHGFFNFNPTFYADWYSQNGHRIASDFLGLHGPVLDSQAAALPAHAGGAVIPPGAVIMVVAQKLNEKPPTWPTQYKYLANPQLKS